VTSTLGKYHLIKKIAAGGMAEIYLARVSGLAGFEKVVVVKRILPQLSTQDQFIQMFLDEARIAATLQHPNIVQMYDIGAADGNYFIAMEYLHGEDVRSIYRRLRDRKQGGMPLDHALNIVIGVASGLHHAHDKAAFDGKPLGIVHRDVTPQNVIVTFDGGVKLVDFGIAKASNRLSETRFGTLKGKIPYMSPEQCQGKPLDRRSDIYAVGIMLYELTTSSRLYRGESDYDIMKQIVEHPLIPPSVRRADYPRELERIALRALAKNPDERYQNVEEMQADLEGFARHERLMVSSIALSSFMKQLFPERAVWRPEATQSDAELSAHVDSKQEPETDPDIDDAMHDSQPSSELTNAIPTPSANGQLSGPAAAAVAADLRSPRRTGLLAAGVALLLVAAGASIWWVTRDGGGEPKQVAAAGAGEPTPAVTIDAGVARVTSPPDAAVVAAADPPDAGTLDRPKPAKPRKPAKPPKPPKPPPAPADKTPGELRVGSNPACILIVDGKSRGETPVGGIKLAPGTHTLQLVNARHGIDKRYKVTVKPGEVVKRSYTFPIK
jgi:serine/threonine protein kinase